MKYATFKEFMMKSSSVNDLYENYKSISADLYDNIYRYGSDKYFEYWRSIKEEKTNLKDLTLDELEILESDIGTFGIFEGEEVPLDFPMFEAEYQGKKVELNKPKRASDGNSKFYVYTKNQKTGKIIKVKFGAAGGGQSLSVKLQDPQAKKSFAARHNCEQANDKTKASYWSCRLPRFAKSLGLSGSGKWW